MGDPSPTNIYVFNGDYVDRGAWGLETLLLIAAWKICLPGSIYLLRGNHETSLCSMVYGFKGELVAKFGTPHWKVSHRNILHAPCPKRASLQINVCGPVRAILSIG